MTVASYYVTAPRISSNQEENAIQNSIKVPLCIHIPVAIMTHDHQPNISGMRQDCTLQRVVGKSEIMGRPWQQPPPFYTTWPALYILYEPFTYIWWYEIYGSGCLIDHLGPISNKMSYCEISQSLESKRFSFRIVQSHRNLTGTSAAVLPMCLSYFQAKS